MYLNLKPYLLSIIIILISISNDSCKKKEIFCTDYSYYFKAKYNNNEICYSCCIASIMDNSDSSYYENGFLSTYITNIFAGDTSKKVFDSYILIFIPGKSTGLYNYNGLTALEYSVSAVYEGRTYSFPTFLEMDKNKFEINIINFDLGNKVIEGTIKGELYNDDVDDFIEITKGEFKAKIAKEGPIFR